jgi:predicted peptidase
LRTFGRIPHWCCTAILLAAAAQGVPGIDLSKDDIAFRKEVYVNKKGDRAAYRLFVPVGYNSANTYPLVLWLHGGDGRGNDNIMQITRGNQLGAHFWMSSDVQAKFPTFVLAPQCPTGENWADPELNQPGKALELALAILARVEKQFAIDPDRVYIVGQSMGGLGVWSLLQTHPDKWAAAVVLAAYDNFTEPKAISRIPLWVFQGDADQIVPVNLVREMMKQLKKLNANLRYTEYHKVDHEVWNKAFAEPELVPWLSLQKRGKTPKGQVGAGADCANH